MDKTNRTDNKKAERQFFVTGIDTDAGKTFITGAMAAYLKRHGEDVTTIKIAQTGCENYSDDILAHRRMMGIDLTEEDKQGHTCPYLFKVPASPHLSARLEDRKIEVSHIDHCIERVSRNHDYTLIEGVGGLFVPLTDDLYLIDWLARQKFSVILVTSSKLGSINHTLMSLEVCRMRKIEVCAMVYNWYGDVLPEIEQDTQSILEHALGKYYPDAVFVKVPELCSDDQVAKTDFSAIFG